MSVAPAGKLDPPWLSVWSEPGDTIERVLATKSWLYVLSPWLLAAVATAAHSVGVMARTARTVPLQDWDFLLESAVDACVIGAVDLYMYGVIMYWTGRMVGGHASLAQMRAVNAWGRASACAALVIDVAVILSVGGATGEIPADAINWIKMFGLAANVWTVVATIAMLRRVQAFDWWRATFNYAASMAFGFLLVWLMKSYLFPLFTMPDLQ